LNEKRILLIEDEAGLVMTLADRLQSEGYVVDSRADGDSGLEEASSGAYDLIVLDLMLPRKSGVEVCRRLRLAGIETPVLMLTARGQVVDKVVGFQTGADDYVTKPFDMMELLVRIQALLRRAPRTSAAAPASFRFGDVQVDFRSAEVKRNGEPVNLSAREFQLLRYLVEHRGSLITRDQLLTEVWGYESLPSTRTVDVHMAWLRQKLEANPRHPEYLLTIRGLGYRFNG
jgi:two-component system, OmpR family, alkaline phosphatase synthesis response regulator PhoP